MKKAKILVVEDQKIILLEIKERLTEMGYTVSGTAQSGKQAIQLAADIVPDLILMDIKLEGSMDGIEAAEIIKSKMDCPIIFLTAYADDSTIQRAKITEPYGYIVKPLDERELRSGIEIALYKNRSEKAIKDSETRYRSIVKTLEGILYVTDIDYNLLMNNIEPDGINNPAAEKCHSYLYELSKPCGHCPLDKLKQGITTRTEVYDNRSKRVFYRVSTPVHLSEEKTVFQNYLIDITERKRNEENIVSMLNEKEILLREIHHRVKNNLQIMLSLIRLQESKASDKQVKSNLKVIENRMNSIAIVHEDLYSSMDLAKIPFKIYVKKLINNLLKAFVEDTQRITVKYDIKDILMPVDYVIPLGMILNELITNSFKHAFPDGRAGTIDIGFNKNGNEYLLQVSDSGIGFPAGIDLDNPNGLGFQILKSLSKQIDCSIEFDKNNGNRVNVRLTEGKFRDAKI